MLVVLIGVTRATPPEEAITPVERYTTRKARALAATHNGRLTKIYDRIYRHEWVEIPKRGLGFDGQTELEPLPLEVGEDFVRSYKPKDDRRRDPRC